MFRGQENLPLLLFFLLLTTQKCATTFISRPEPAPEPWAWFNAWPTAMWWRPELKLAHSRLMGSLGDRETSGPAPSRDSVAKHAADQRDTAGLATWSQTQSGWNYGSFSFLPAVFWSQILIELSWEDVATWAAPPGGTGRNTQEAVVWRWPLYSTTLQPGWRRSQSWTQQTQWAVMCVRNRRVLLSSIESSKEPSELKNLKNLLVCVTHTEGKISHLGCVMSTQRYSYKWH